MRWSDRNKVGLLKANSFSRDMISGGEFDYGFYNVEGNILAVDESN